jgi:zearalenone synthase (highly reducing iterative type I polyketide synthase)
MEHGLIPPNIHFSKVNPALPLDEWNMAVPTKLTPWPVSPTGRRMSVSGFGMGGTNGHVVLEGFNPRIHQSLTNETTNGTTNGTANGLVKGSLTNGVLSNAAASARHSGKRLFVISSQDQAGFKRVGDSLVAHLDSHGPSASSPEYLANLAHTLAVARSGLSWRAGFLAENAAEVREKLAAELSDDAARLPSSPPRIG